MLFVYFIQKAKQKKSHVGCVQITSLARRSYFLETPLVSVSPNSQQECQYSHFLKCQTIPLKVQIIRI